MSILETIIALVAPHTCIGCGAEEDRLVCEGCVESLVDVPSRCYHCKAVTESYAVCRDCATRTPLRQVVVYTHHADIAKELVHRAKYERARAGTQEIANLLVERIDELPQGVILTHVPTATSRVRQRGYDHAQLIAHQLGRRTKLPCRTLLARVGQAHQVGANRAARLRQLKDAFRPVHEADIKGAHVVLVDDVLTTGATLETAARVLKRAGAKRVSAIVFAQA